MTQQNATFWDTWTRGETYDPKLELGKIFVQCT